MVNVVIVPGNGHGCASANFYPWLAKQLRLIELRDGTKLKVALQQMPDPDVAREKIWLPFIRDVLGANEDTVLVGHSSGACAGLRLAETDKLAGLVVVSCTPSDLDDENEAASGYYNRPWRWDSMVANVPKIVQFGSIDDPFIPIELQRSVADGITAACDTFNCRSECNALTALAAEDPGVSSSTGRGDRITRGAPSGTAAQKHSFRYIELDGRSHFFDRQFVECLEVVVAMVGAADS